MQHYPGRAIVAGWNNVKTTTSRLLGRELADKLKRLYRKPVFWVLLHDLMWWGTVVDLKQSNQSRVKATLFRSRRNVEEARALFGYGYIRHPR
jgi:hypothetical protein